MIGKLRFWIAIVLMWVGAHVAPRAMRPVLFNVLQSFRGLSSQTSMGRVGGVIVTAWHVTPDGKNFSLGQMAHVGQAAKEYRETFESIMSSEDNA